VGRDKRLAMVAKRCLAAPREGYSRLMAPDDGLIVIFASLHLVALLLGGLLFAMFLRSDARSGSNGPEEDDEGGGGGGNDRIGDQPKTSPSGGIPLPDAVPAPIRLRGPGRLADLRPQRVRRTPAHPAQPGRRRVPSR
jgi:hypothetical protein